VGWWKGKGSHVDFTNPAAANWFAGQLKALRDRSRVTTRSGSLEPVISGFKTDDGEGMTNKDSPDTAGGVYISDDSFFSDGRTGIEMRNGYCILYHQTVAGVLGNEGPLFARSGFTGTQAFPGCWAGDNQPNFGAGDGLPSVIVAGLSAAMSGYSIWGHDVGGYQQNFEAPPADVDLFMRWAQVGCFSPIMQMHRQVVSDQADQNHLNLRQYPWGYHQGNETIASNQALANYRFYADLHTRLFPYIYSFAKVSSETGLPIIRPLVLIDQDDPNARTIDHSYHFGDAFLVAPILAPGSGPRQVYLPAGTWIDFWDNTLRAGGQNIAWTNADRTKFPLFVRKGSIVPLLLGDVATLCDANYVNSASPQTWDGGLLFRIHPDVDSQFTLFDATAIRCQVAQAATRITLTSTPRAVQLSILGSRPAGSVKRDGAIINEAATPGGFASASQAWRHGPATGFLDVKFSHVGGTTIVNF
jgi:alpha-D-xyloside xylohydrolase